MPKTKTVPAAATNPAVSAMPRFSATALATRMSAITREVMKSGATVITRHDQPAMVLMSVERYIELEQSAGQNLEALTREFDDLYARMQEPGVAQNTLDALDLGR